MPTGARGSAPSSTHLVVQTTTSHWYIISTLANRSDTQVIHIERFTGHLQYNPFPHRSLFASPKDAIKYIASYHGKDTKFRNVVKCDAIIGFQIICRGCHLCVVTKSECELVLPPRHRVYRVKEVKWISIGIGYPVLQTKQEERQLEKLKSFPIADLHFYCETYDLTRPYPSKHAPHDYDEEFAWNHQLARPFHEIGLKEWTVVLLQGLAIGKVVKLQQKNVFVALLCKRSSWNPGTRYNARGLNERLSPGNEYEVEQLCWITGQAKTIKYSSVIWRRGTVPIHWKSEITNAVSDANITIAKDPFKNIELYYQRIVDKYGSLPIVCLDLLRMKHVHAEEDRLSQSYQQSLTFLKTMMNIDIEHFRYDWHHRYKADGLNKAVNGMWNLLGDKLKDFGVTSGEMKVGTGTKVLQKTVHQKQKGLLRVNCADSLDRTNLCSFFNGIHIIAEQLRSIGINVISKKAQNPWSTLNFSLDEVNKEYPPMLLLKYAEMYIECGDVCATLYTNTGAMHTKAMREYASHLPAARSNTQLIVERRYQNMFNDQARQSQYDMFLGVNWDRYFPSHIKHLRNGELRYVSHSPSFIFKSIPSYFPDMNINEEQTLLYKSNNHIWICPENQSVVSVDINLPYYCRVSEIALTIRHGDSWETSPAKMDLFVGEHFDDAILAFQQLQLPRCKDQTKLLFPLPPQISGNMSRYSVYDFSGKKARPRMRCIRITFYDVPTNISMTLGQIQIFGVLPNNEKTSLQFFKELQQISTSQSLQQAVVELEKKEHEKKKQEIEKKVEEESSDSDSSSSDSSSSTSSITSSESVEDVVLDAPDTEAKESNEEIEELDPDSPSAVEGEDQIDDEANVEDLLDSPDNEAGEGTANTVSMTENLVDDYLNANEETNLKNFLTNVLNTKEVPDIDREKAKSLYQQFVSEICSNGRSSKLSFPQALELELARLSLNLSPTERDSILVALEFKIARFNPNLFVYYRDPKIERNKRRKLKSSHCHMCNSSTKLRKFSCHYCRHSFCKKCISKTKVSIREFGWKGHQQVCLACYSSLQRQEALLQEILKYLRMQEERQTRDLTFENIFTDMYPPHSVKLRNYPEDSKETYVSEFPLSNILGNVPTDSESAPVESILFPADILPGKYWIGPKNVSSVNIIIALPATVLLSRLVLIADDEGYSAHDIPAIQVSSCERLPNQVNHGEWRLLNNEVLASTPSTPLSKEAERVVLPKQELEYTIPVRTVARMVQLTVTFQNASQTFVERRLHLGRILVYGKVVEKKPSYDIFSKPEQQKLYKSILSKKSNIQRTYIKADSRLSKSTHTMDLYKSPNTPVGGFQFTVKHGARYGILSQVKDIRVSILLQNEKKEMESQEVIGHYVIPKVEDGTSLIYDFKKRYQSVSAVRFQYLSSHSAPEMSLGAIVLYDWEVKG